MNLCTFYDMLRASPLAKDRNDAALEEVAIWLDMNNMSTRSSIMKILKAIEKNYHDVAYDYIEDEIVVTSHHTSSIANTIRMPLLMPHQYFSDNALYWLFKMFSETNFLDSIVLDKKFIDFVKKTKDTHKKKSMTWKMVGSMKCPIPSQRDQILHEVFAELMDIIERKMQNANRRRV